ncbi:hypothetical protein SEA_REDFIELD_7 [Microbacterium phage Redfield]|uniref:Uncharacterized protein n=5 Tax=Ilzatvirus hamlet TaxID=2560591 RepID=A0A345MEH6_9CAUD|nr:hypothetical protein PBI_PEPPINO_7 [Microbacterium phage Peppino]AVR56093.1 hypothetical protein PBI_BEEBEE8_8 [Microbacterium phage BeeBee8]AVR56272.1 hypothetical protein PBI_ETNA_7 [Microbacterium phage Etna]AXH46397.1 hypothetical protein SEA_REDFIELD_7 [Microbacterium phage Redfield]AXH68957.1 hypothetical protein SCHNAPSIDEE_7 [Microbacterium phage Schnapsidee]QKY80244.1 hypothetical protein SEA_LEAFUS_7 [Microbacterium phage Leafus]QYW01469.1 hypothetical protein SEA_STORMBREAKER8_7
MTDAQETPEVVEVSQPTVRTSQAAYDAVRKESKARADKRVAENTKKAKKAKDKAIAARNASLGQREALSGAAAIEKRINDRAKARAEETS